MLMLFDGAIRFAGLARGPLEAKEFGESSEHLLRAVQLLLGGLQHAPGERGLAALAVERLVRAAQGAHEEAEEHSLAAGVGHDRDAPPGWQRLVGQQGGSVHQFAQAVRGDDARLEQINVCPTCGQRRPGSLSPIPHSHEQLVTK